MPYFEIRRRLFAYNINGPLPRDTHLSATINGQPRDVYIIGEGDSLTIDGVEKQGPEGAVLFDRTSRLEPQRALVHLTNQEALRLQYIRSQVTPGAFQDTLGSVHRRALEQTGVREPGKRTMFERIEAVVSLGRSEDF